MQKNVLLSIKPEFVEKIFSGVKRYEFRRVLFRAVGVTKIVMYASQPVQKVVGEFEIEEIVSLQPQALWEYTKDQAGLERDIFDSYFQDRPVGYAIKIKGAKRYSRPLDLRKDYGITQPPQSFCYLSVDPESRDKILEFVT